MSQILVVEHQPANENVCEDKLLRTVSIFHDRPSIKFFYQGSTDVQTVQYDDLMNPNLT